MSVSNSLDFLLSRFYLSYTSVFLTLPSNLSCKACCKMLISKIHFFFKPPIKGNLNTCTAFNQFISPYINSPNGNTPKGYLNVVFFQAKTPESVAIRGKVYICAGWQHECRQCRCSCHFSSFKY